MLEILLKQFGKEDRKASVVPPGQSNLSLAHWLSFWHGTVEVSGAVDVIRKKKSVYYMLEIKNYKLRQYFENL